MAATNKIYGTLETNLANKLVNDLDAGGTTVKYCLLDNTYTFDPTHNDYADISGDEVAGVGYVAGGVAATTKTLTATNVAGVSYSLAFDCDDPTFTTVTLVNVRYCVGYDATPAAAGDRTLLHCIDLGEDVSPTAQTLVIVLHSSGAFYFQTRYD